jgi:hypothetical protein
MTFDKFYSFLNIFQNLHVTLTRINGDEGAIEIASYVQYILAHLLPLGALSYIRLRLKASDNLQFDTLQSASTNIKNLIIFFTSILMFFVNLLKHKQVHKLTMYFTSQELFLATKKLVKRIVISECALVLVSYLVTNILFLTRAAHHSTIWQNLYWSLNFFFEHYLMLAMVYAHAFGLILAGHLHYLNRTISMEINESEIERTILRIDALCDNVEQMKEQLNDTMGIQMLLGIFGIFSSCAIAVYTSLEEMSRPTNTPIPQICGFILYFLILAVVCYTFYHIEEQVNRRMIHVK